MAKYIIDIPDDGQCQYRYNEDTKELKFPCPRLDPNSFMGLDITISGATPYTEPERKAIEDEVWDLAREIAYCMSVQECIDTGMFHDDDIYDSASGVLEKLTYQEAKEKYDAWKAEKDNVVKQKVVDLAEEIGVHRLYAIVREIRGE